MIDDKVDLDTRVRIVAGTHGDSDYNGYEGIIVSEHMDSAPGKRWYDVVFETAPQGRPKKRHFSTPEFKVLGPNETLEEKRERLMRELEETELQIEGLNSAENLPDGTLVVVRIRGRIGADAGHAFHKSAGKWAFIDTLGDNGVRYSSVKADNQTVQNTMTDKIKYDTQVIKPEGN